MSDLASGVTLSRSISCKWWPGTFIQPIFVHPYSSIKPYLDIKHLTLNTKLAQNLSFYPEKNLKNTILNQASMY